MQTGSFSLAGSAYRRGTPVLVQERCRLQTAGQQLHNLQPPELGRLLYALGPLVDELKASERWISRRGSGKPLVSGGSDLKEREDTEEALQPSA